jgi:ribosomal protein S18 acetylase RimI-like enzyme
MTTIIRPLQADDRPALLRFLAAVPADDRNFFKEQTPDAETVEGWLTPSRARRLVAEDDESREIVAYVAVLPGAGRSSHVGELRLMVLPARRGAGLGRRLAERGLQEALELELTNIFVEVSAEQEGLIGMFRGLGFEPEAVLRDFIRDAEGQTHDLLMLTHRVEAVWSEILTLGLDEAL